MEKKHFQDVSNQHLENLVVLKPLQREYITWVKEFNMNYPNLLPQKTVDRSLIEGFEKYMAERNQSSYDSILLNPEMSKLFEHK